MSPLTATASSSSLKMVPQVPGQMNMDGTQQEAPKLLKLVQHA